MAQRVFVKVTGFTDVERHALNTVFRLSEQRGIIYSLWDSSAPEPPKLALVDGQSHEARLELETRGIPFSSSSGWGWWRPPTRGASSSGPCHGPMWSSPWTSCSPRPSPSISRSTSIWVRIRRRRCGDLAPAPPKRALIASADRDERLYLRAKLALAELTQADEAETGAQALELARAHHYAVALVDFALHDVDGWAFLKELTEAKPAIEHVIVIKAQASLGERARGWAAGAKGFLDKPPHPGKLQDLLREV